MKKVLINITTVALIALFCVVLILEGCFINRTAFWMRHGFDFMEAAHWAEDDVSESVIKLLGWDKEKEETVKSYPMVNANIDWVLLVKP